MNFWSRFPNKELIIESATLDGQSKIYNVNAHVHSPYSFSAFKSIDHALSLAKKENVRIVGINDFYSTSGYAEWAENCINHKVFPLFNIEFVGLSLEEQEKGIRINDPNNPGRIYMSGKGLSYPVNLDEPYHSQLEAVKSSSNEQVKEMCIALNQHLESVGVDIKLSFENIVKEYTMGMVRERHLAKALRIAVFNKTSIATERMALLTTVFNKKTPKSDIRNEAALENEIRGNLLKAGGAAFIPENPDQFLDLTQIREIILKSGGIPTYPLLADSVNGGYTEFEESKELLLKTLIEKGIYSIEFITNRNSTEALEEYAKFFIKHNFLVSFGSEHNTPELIPLKLKNKLGNDLSPTLLDINYSGACILAAHQYLTAKTGSGILTPDGTIKSSEITNMKKLGSCLLEYFYTN